MRYARSFLLGSSIVFIVVVLSLFVFYFSPGKCSSGSFPCDNDTVCVSQKAFCDSFSDCKDGFDENTLQCGQYYGSKDVLNEFLEKSFRDMQENKSSRVKGCNIPNVSDFHPKCKCTGKNSGLHLQCKGANLISVPYAPSAKHLVLMKNRINLTPKAFADFSALESLTLSENEITEIPDKSFYGLNNLTKLYLRKNKLMTVEASTFENLNQLAWLFLDHNHLTKFKLPMLPNIQWLDLSNNLLTLNDVVEVFPNFPKIRDLFLSYNLISEIKGNTFENLSKLHLLDLSYNRIHKIEYGAFSNLSNLTEMNLSNNLLHSLHPGLMYPLKNLAKLHLGNNELEITENIFPESTKLFALDLDGIDMKKINFTALNSLKSLKYLKLAKFHYCSLVPAIPRCDPNSDGVSDLKNLLSKPTLRFCGWLIAFITIGGNLLVLWGRCTSRDENRALSLLIRNLAVADMLMGVYLLAIEIQDSRYREVYHQFSSQWTRSWACITIGTIAMISSEVSMLILVFMSVERFLLIVNPLGGYARLNPNTARRALVIIWCIGIVISILPIIYWRNGNMFYGTYSGMCFPLHLIEKFPVGWEYSSFLFLGINLIGLIVIATVYCGMFISVRQTRRAALPSAADCEFAIRFFFIVFTDAACWAPIICLKILNFFGIEMSGDVYAWLSVFILPLNSAVNPLLYTFTTPKYRDNLLSFSWRYSVNRTSNADTESSRTSSHKNITCNVIGLNKNNNIQQPADSKTPTINTSHLSDFKI